MSEMPNSCGNDSMRTISCQAADRIRLLAPTPQRVLCAGASLRLRFSVEVVHDCLQD